MMSEKSMMTKNEHIPKKYATCECNQNIISMLTTKRKGLCHYTLSAGLSDNE